MGGALQYVEWEKENAPKILKYNDFRKKPFGRPT